jgi:predicted permease
VNELLTRLRALPGVDAAAIGSDLPFGGNTNGATMYVDGVTDVPIRYFRHRVTPDYFATLGIPLLAGREFDERDTTESPKVVIISERMARHFAGNPIGQRIDRGPDAREVVGVARDLRYGSVKDAPREVVYYPIFQVAPKSIFYSPTFEIRYAGSAAERLPFIQEAVARAEPGLTMFRVKTLERQTEESFARERLLAWLTSYFGGFAVLLACIGLYGLMSYGVTQRTAEMGLRMALGAQQSQISWMVLKRGLGQLAIGVPLGLALAYVVTLGMKSLLVGIGPGDPVTLASILLIVAMVTVAACLVPARRAARLNPTTALSN